MAKEIHIASRSTSSAPPTRHGGSEYELAARSILIGEDTVAAYNWINQPLFTIDLPIHLPRPIKKAENALDGAIDSTVRDILSAAGLRSILQEVTGKPKPLAQAADVWLEQAHQTKAVADELRQAAHPLPRSWRGAASAASSAASGSRAAGMSRRPRRRRRPRMRGITLSSWAASAYS